MQRLHITVRAGPLEKKKEENKRKYNGPSGTQKSPGRPNFVFPLRQKYFLP